MATLYSISWTDVVREAADHLAHLIAHGTSSSPSRELPAARYLLNLFEAEGVPAFLLPPATGSSKPGLSPGRPNVVAHLPGSGAEEPLLLISHLDSAAQPLPDLDIPALSVGRTLRGPGALMGTHLAVAQAMALILLARNEIALRRTVRFAATSGGAGGRGLGLRTLADEHLEHITSDLALGWGAFSWTAPDGTPCSLLTSAEKGSLNLKLRSEGSGGRIGVGIGKDPVERLVKALNELSRLEFPVRPSDASRNFIRSVAETMPSRQSRDLLEGLNDPDIAGEVLDAVEAAPAIDPGLKALIRAALQTRMAIIRLDSSAPDGLEPWAAEAEVQCCYPPGEDVEELAYRLMECLKSDGVYLAEKTVVEPSRSELTPEIQAPVRAALCDVDRNARMVAGLSPWPTGLAALRRYGTSVFGWEPFASSKSLSETLSSRGSGAETLDIEDFEREIRAFYSLLVRIAQ